MSYCPDDDWLDVNVCAPSDRDYNEFRADLYLKFDSHHATVFCMRNPDLCRLIASFCSCYDLLNLGPVDKLWNDTVKFLFHEIRHEREYKYLIFKSHPLYDTDRKMVSRLVNNRDHNTAEVYLLGGAMHANNKTTYMLKDTLYPVAFREGFESTPSGIVCSAGAADLAGNYHLFGGWKDSELKCVNTVWKIDFDDPKLSHTEIAPLPFPCCFAGVDCTIRGDFIHTGGGNSPFNDAKCYSDVFLLRNGAHQWEEDVIPAMHTVRCGHRAATLFNDSLLVAGGYAGNNVFLSSVELLDSHLDRWTRLPDMNVARSGAASVLGPGGAMYMCGGTPNSADSLNSMERYDPREGKWTLLCPMLTERSFAAACQSVHHGFYVMGGMTGGAVCDSIEFYDFRMDRWEYHVGGTSESPELNKISAYMTLKL